MNFRLGLLITAVIAAVLALVGFKVNNLALQSEAALSKPWIEVVSLGVFELAEDQKTEKRELQTGDELQNGMAVGVRKGALANIYFPDGSVARLDSGTRLVVETGDFDSKTNKLNIQLNLLWGRVWSKVITVLTPESTWEVKTTNAVAVVRGTAFGVEYIEEGKSNVVSYENKVQVKMIDPETEKIMPDLVMMVEAKKMLEVKKEAIENIKAQLASGELRQAASAIATKAGEPLMEVKVASEKVLAQDWVKRGVEADEKLNQKIETIREKVRDQKEAIKEFRKEIQDEFRGKVEVRRKAIKADVEKIKNETQEKVSDLKNDLQTKVLETETKVIPIPDSKIDSVNSIPVKTISVQPQSKSLMLKTDNKLNQVKEGDNINFQAFVLFSDGSTKEVTAEANWQALGKIGAMKLPGLFVAQLDPSVSEFGSVPGAVAVSWKDPETGNVLEAASPIFNVEAQADTNFDPTRG